jgi:hypothetical protein
VLTHASHTIAPALLATGALTLLLTASQGLGWTRISLPYLLGTVLVLDRQRALALGFCLHWSFGLVFALGYAWLFETLGRAGPWLGALVGFAHGVFALVVVMDWLASCHPRIASRHHGPTPTRKLEPPGFLALNYGRSTPVLTLVAHVIYGAILGALYAPRL